jgi:hypothetical protein
MGALFPGLDDLMPIQGNAGAQCVESIAVFQVEAVILQDSIQDCLFPLERYVPQVDLDAVDPELVFFGWTIVAEDELAVQGMDDGMPQGIIGRGIPEDGQLDIGISVGIAASLPSQRR